MNHWLNELMADERQKELQAEMGRIRLEETGKARRPGISARILRGLGKWLIAKGEGLLRRYENPNTPAPRTQRYAH